ncbi:hypothetical protein F383_04600 [Gossypium arboreum]|uniref:Uncharacterized protein n=1 Tax=Gossypium arboreum TaxID=29729 RepID=A0A0B0PN98_GOSAR|nr:hypothetical protein F383_04600 [Gossypium arboreum]
MLVMLLDNMTLAYFCV